MMFQIFASLVLACIAIYAYSQAHVAPFLTRFAILVVGFGEYLVLFPQHATAIAVFFGIGRGADLVFYLWILLSVVMMLNMHLRMRTLNDRLIALTRELALQECQRGTAEVRRRQVGGE
jgi:small membrane protein